MRLLKKTGFVALLALTLAATIGAASASAYVIGIPPIGYPANVTGEDSSNSSIYIHGKTLSCNSPAFSASLSESVSVLATSTTKDGACKFSEGSQPALKMNGCHFSFDPNEETGTGKFTGTFSVGPAGCGPVKLEGVNYPCKDSLEAASWGGSATFEDTGEGFSIEAADSAINYTYEGLACGGKGSDTAQYTGKWSVSATNAAGELANLDVAPRPAIRLAGGPEEKEPAKLQADSYPQPVVSNGSTFTFTSSFPVTCATTRVTGTLAEATSQLNLAPSYGTCTAKLGETTAPATVTMNGCSYALSVQNVFPYAGTLGVGCTGESPIEFKVYSNSEMKTVICKVKVAAQAGKESVGLENWTSEADEGVSASVAAQGLAYERTGILCGGTKIGSDGKINYSTILWGQS